jgi:flagellar hook-basal body complex protein FliE
MSELDLSDNMNNYYASMAESHLADFASFRNDAAEIEKSMQELAGMQAINDEEFQKLIENGQKVSENMISASDKEAKMLELQEKYQQAILDAKEAIVAIDELQAELRDKITESYDREIQYLEAIAEMLEH